MRLSGICSVWLLLALSGCDSKTAMYANESFAVYPDRVVQDSFEAIALSDTHITSNYKSPANMYLSPLVSFKFAINGNDNEMEPGIDHKIMIDSNWATTPLIEFGKPLAAGSDVGKFLEPNTEFTIRLDMRPVLRQFDSLGFFTTYNGEKIYKEDFKGVWVAGSSAPLTWDFDNLHQHKELKLEDADKDSVYETTVMLNVPENQKQTAAEWKLRSDISAYPQYHSQQVLANALYNMALEEMTKAIEPDSTLRTGEEWAGVWTRDVSYSTILSMSYLLPDVARNSLMRKVNSRKRIIQDTGTGGAWPVSTDRMIWATAAWHIFLATGDTTWMKDAYEIISNSLQDDYKTCYDAETGLVKGESSFLDWREQTYPKWMQPADIFESLSLGTNAVHYQANIVAGKMAAQLGNNTDAQLYGATAKKIKDAMNETLWVENKGYYGQYAYGRVYKMLSPRSDALGEALAIIFEIAGNKRMQTMMGSVPVMDFGIPCIYPQIPGLPPYHNNAVWPFVQSYWMWAAAKAGNEQQVAASIGAIYRAAALFLTNKENFVAENGDHSQTVINSSNMLWSLSGNISIVHRILFGINFTEAGLHFTPFIPESMEGHRTLKNFKYRNAILDIEINGFGTEAGYIALDGKTLPSALVPADLTGRHKLRIEMNGKRATGPSAKMVKSHFTPETPLTTDSLDALRWLSVPRAIRYTVWRNLAELAPTQQTFYVLPETKETSAYQVAAADESANLSFFSEPLLLADSLNYSTFDMTGFAPRSLRNHAGYNGNGFVEISKTVNRSISIPVTVEADGTYMVSFRYANGNGPVNTENKCAIRSLYIGELLAGAVVFPQRGTNEWSNWGTTNMLKIKLEAGQQVLRLQFEAWNENMHGEINQAMIDEMEWIRID